MYFIFANLGPLKYAPNDISLTTLVGAKASNYDVPFRVLKVKHW